jgi:hypothetical protein
VKIHISSGMKLGIGDFIYIDFDKPFVGRCPRCKRQGTQKITKVYTVTKSPSATGFWKLPTEDGPSSDMKTDSSGTLSESPPRK